MSFLRVKIASDKNEASGAGRFRDMVSRRSLLKGAPLAAATAVSVGCLTSALEIDVVGA